jgi:hypothetical protein
MGAPWAQPMRTHLVPTPDPRKRPTASALLPPSRPPLHRTWWIEGRSADTARNGHIHTIFKRRLFPSSRPPCTHVMHEVVPLVHVGQKRLPRHGRRHDPILRTHARTPRGARG